MSFDQYADLQLLQLHHTQFERLNDPMQLLSTVALALQRG